MHKQPSHCPIPGQIATPSAAFQTVIITSLEGRVLKCKTHPRGIDADVASGYSKALELLVAAIHNICIPVSHFPAAKAEPNGNQNPKPKSKTEKTTIPDTNVPTNHIQSF